MDDTITLQSNGYHSVLATHPVTRESYKQFLHDTGRAVPHACRSPNRDRDRSLMSRKWTRSPTATGKVSATAARTAFPPSVSFRSSPTRSVSREPPPMSGRMSKVSGRSDRWVETGLVMRVDPGD